MTASPDVVTGGKKKLWQPLYDSDRVATGAATASLDMFTQQIGQGTSAHAGAGVKKLVDTNMRNPGSLPQSQFFKALGLRVKLKPTVSNVATNTTDLENIQRTGLIELKIGDSKKIEQQLCDFGGGIGVDGFASTTASTTSVMAVHNGVAAPDAIWWFRDCPIWIMGGQVIELKLSWATAPTVIAAVIVVTQFEGYLYGDITA